MKQKFIIKNIGKYNDIKLAKGLDLMQFKMSPRKITDHVGTGISTGTYGDYWFNTPKGKALFKTFYGYGHEIRNTRMYNELLCYELCSQIGMPCAEYEFAHYDEDDGVVSYNIMKKGEQLQSLDEFAYGTPDGEINLEALSTVFDEYIEDGYKINKKQAIIDLYRIAIFDYLTLQTDRNDANINMIYNEKNKSYKVAPLFDNEFAFAGQVLLRMKQSKKYSSDKLMSTYADYAKILAISYDDYENKHRIYNQVKLISAYAQKYPALKKVALDMISNLDIDQAIASLEQKGHTISKEYKQYVKNVFAYTTNTLSDAIKENFSQKDISELENIM